MMTAKKGSQVAAESDDDSGGGSAPGGTIAFCLHSFPFFHMFFSKSALR
jgi:hypothetical protein